MIRTSILFCAVFLLSMLVTGLMRRYALKSHLLDHPNERSSHVRATPRGGGVGLVFGSTVAALFLWATGILRPGLAAALIGGGIAVALVGFADDRGAVSVRIRMAVHLGASVFAMYCIGGLGPLQVGDHLIDLGIFGDILGVIGLAWAINLFNFMDGIDGIAGSQAVFMAGAGAALAMIAGMSGSTLAAALCLAAASLGFLVWNWPPARIFMGDVGSGYLGFALAVIALAAVGERAVMFPVWLILGGVFVIDSMVTLLRRLARRERVYEAHRSHAYQWQARRWNSHLRVTVACFLVNLLWLAPLAWLCVRFPAYSGWFVAAAWLPLIGLAVACGAGRPEAKAKVTGSAG